MAATSTDSSGSRRRVVEAVGPEISRVLAQKTGAERLAIAAGMFRSARRMIESHLRAENPEWDPEELRCEVARRLAHGAR